MATKRKMEVEIVAKDKSKAGTQAAASNLDKVASSAKGVAIAAAAAGVALGTAVVGKSLTLWAAQEQAILQVEKRLKSTGAAAWTSSRQLQDMAAALQKTTVYGDETILQMQSLLLTFKDIKGPIFQETTSAILDMASALAQSSGGEPDLRSAATMVGKALQDPVLGLTAMSRAGIQFSDDQKEVIKSLVETGQKAKAQTIILAELNSQFGGAAGAVGLTGAARQAKNAFGDLFEQFGKGLTESGAIKKSLESLTDYMGDDGTKAKITGFGDSFAEVITKLTSGFITEDYKTAAKRGLQELIDELSALRLNYTAKNRAVRMAELQADILEAKQMLLELSIPKLGGFTIMGAGDSGDLVSPTIFGPTETLGGIGQAVTVGQPGEQGAESPEAAARRKERDDYILGLTEEENAFNYSLLTRQERLTADYEERLLKLQEFNDNQILSDEAFIEYKWQLEENYENELTALKEKESKKRLNTEMANMKAAADFGVNALAIAGALTNANNRKQFKQIQTMQAGLTLIHGITTAWKAASSSSNKWEAIATVAAIMGSVASFITTIKSQTPDGESSAPSGGNVSFAAGQGQVAQPTPSATSAAPAGPSYNIHVYGNVVDHDQFARELIAPLEQAKLDGVTA